MEVVDTKNGGGWHQRMDVSGPGMVAIGTWERRWPVLWIVGDWCPRMKTASFRDVGDGCCKKMAVPSSILRPEAATLGRLAGRQTSGHWGRVTWEGSQEPHAAAAGGKFIPRQRASGGLGWVDGLALKAIQTPIKPSG